MMTSDQLMLKHAAYESFRYVLQTYQKVQTLHSVNLFYNGHNSTVHSAEDIACKLTKTALVDYWQRKLVLELDNLRTFGVDADAEMPAGVA